MKFFKNQSGSKMVKVAYDYEMRVYRCFYVQVYQGEQQVLAVKDFKSENNVQKWAVKMLAA